jgi:hypothetical protein
MKFEMATPKVRPSKIPSETPLSEASPHSDLAPDPSAEPTIVPKIACATQPANLAPDLGAELATLVSKIACGSIATFEKLLCEIQEAKKYLQSEEERIQREAANYANLAQNASASVKLISDTVREWRDAAHPAFNQARLTPAIESSNAVTG